MNAQIILLEELERKTEDSKIVKKLLQILLTYQCTEEIQEIYSKNLTINLSVDLQSIHLLDLFDILMTLLSLNIDQELKSLIIRYIVMTKETYLDKMIS